MAIFDTLSKFHSSRKMYHVTLHIRLFYNQIMKDITPANERTVCWTSRSLVSKPLLYNLSHHWHQTFLHSERWVCFENNWCQSLVVDIMSWTSSQPWVRRVVLIVISPPVWPDPPVPGVESIFRFISDWWIKMWKNWLKQG